MKKTAALVLILLLTLCLAPAALGEEIPGLFVKSEFQWSWSTVETAEEWHGQLPDGFCFPKDLDRVDAFSDEPFNYVAHCYRGYTHNVRGAADSIRQWLKENRDLQHTMHYAAADESGIIWYYDAYLYTGSAEAVSFGVDAKDGSINLPECHVFIGYSMDERTYMDTLIVLHSADFICGQEEEGR